jgi:hypothetical protein
VRSPHSSAPLPAKNRPIPDNVRLSGMVVIGVHGSVPVSIFVRSFEITCSFGRENDVRSEQTLRNGKVALECMRMYWGGHPFLYMPCKGHSQPLKLCMTLNFFDLHVTGECVLNP